MSLECISHDELEPVVEARELEVLFVWSRVRIEESEEECGRNVFVGLSMVGEGQLNVHWKSEYCVSSTCKRVVAQTEIANTM